MLDKHTGVKCVQHHKNM